MDSPSSELHANRIVRLLLAATALAVAAVITGMLWHALSAHPVARMLSTAGVLAIVVAPYGVLAVLAGGAWRHERRVALYAIGTMIVSLLGVFLALAAR